MVIGFRILMFVLGAVFGSFLCCQAWRIRRKEMGKKKLGKWSVCLSCGKRLKWYDNVPILSWLLLGGRCRYCKEKIGIMEILSEVLVGLSFLGLSFTINFEYGIIYWVIFGFACLLLMALSFLAIYDGAWGELPDFALIIAGIFAGVIAIIKFIYFGISFDVICNFVGAILMLGGIYLVLYLVSRGKWVGNGDWILGTIIGITLGNIWLSLWVMFVSNLLGCAVMGPVIKKKGKMRIHFGPFLVIAFVIIYSFSSFLSSLLVF